MLAAILSVYKPAKFAAPLPRAEADKTYPAWRRQMMLTIFAGYAGYYFVRSNFSIAKPYMIKELGLTTGDVGLIATGLSVAYGVSKFVMGSVSDRSNPRYFMATGLIVSGIINLFFTQLHSVPAMACAWFANGWFQGMGWAPCARILTHWFSDRERGTKFAEWNVAHNVGAGLAGPLCSLALMMCAAWTSLFYVPAIVSIIMGVLIAVFLRDTPQSVGLPAIEEYKNDYPETAVADREKEMTAKEIFLGHILNNRNLWILAFANLFVYVVRYGVLTWAPTYLMSVKCCSGGAARWLFAVYEYAGIPGMLVAGWMTDRFFSGRRGPVGVAYMAVVTAAVAVYWLNPPGHYFVDMCALATAGFFIYGPVMLVGVAAVDLVPKKAAGTAAGLTGFFGYVGGATIAELGIGKAVQHYGWGCGFAMVLASGILAMALLALTWHAHERHS
ncbi:MAG: MFS transporter [Elusimicrobiales bacterium]